MIPAETSRLLDGRVALVTGGAGGLGSAISESLGAAGAQVIVADVRESEAAAIASAGRDSGYCMSPLGLDLRDEAAAEAAFRSAVAEFGRIDILVNNAGTDVTLPIDELSIDDWDRVMDVNLRGPFVMSRLAVQAMKRQRAGHIVNIVSTAAKRAWPNAAVYHASKWGLLGFSHALHAEVRPRGIKVTAVIAGGMRTPFLLDRFPDIDQSTLQDPAAVAHTVKFVLTSPDESVIPEIMVLPMRETSWP